MTTKAHATRFSGLSPFLLAALLLGGCEAKGVDPPTDRLFNPVALAVDPQGAFLLVANGDFGLAYNSASVTPVDLREVGRQLDLQGLRQGEPRQDVPLDIEGALMPDLTARIGAFAGRMRIDPTGRVAYVTSREESTIYALELVRNDQGGLTGLDCGGVAEPLQECAASHQLVAYAEEDGLLLREPFGFDFLLEHGAGGPPRPRGLLATYLRTGDVALFPLNPATSLPIPEAGQADHQDLAGFASKDLVVHPDGQQVFVTSRKSSLLRALRLLAAEAEPLSWSIEDQGSLDTGNAGAVSSTDTRAIAVSPDGDRLFVARRHIPSTSTPQPAELVVLSRTLSVTGSVRIDVIGSLLLQERPSAMALWPGEGQRPSLLFVVCYAAGVVDVIDVDNLLVVQSIVVGAGPYDIVLAPAAEGGTDLGGLGLAYVARFTTHEITVINIDPAHPRWLQVVGQIRGDAR